MIALQVRLTQKFLWEETSKILKKQTVLTELISVTSHFLFLCLSESYFIPLWIFAHCNSQLFCTLLNSKQHLWSPSFIWFLAHILWYHCCGWPASPFTYFSAFSLDDKHPNSAVYILGFSRSSAQYFLYKGLYTLATSLNYVNHWLRLQKRWILYWKRMRRTDFVRFMAKINFRNSLDLLHFF